MRGQSIKVSKRLLYLAVVALTLLLTYALLIPRFTGLEACPIDGKVRLEYFYSETCPACDRQKPILADFMAEFGPYIELVPQCVYIHKGDDKKCIEMAGEESFLNAMDRANEIKLHATPTLVFGCDKVVVGIHYRQDLESLACSRLKPSPAVCG